MCDWVIVTDCWACPSRLGCTWDECVLEAAEAFCMQLAKMSFNEISIFTAEKCFIWIV